MPLRLRDDGSGKFLTGRPSDYRPEYCDMLLAYFNITPYVESPVTFQTKSFTKTETKRLPSKFPTLEGFAARELGTDVHTLMEWAKEHPEFHAAYMRAKALQKDVLIDGAMSGVYDSKFSQFVAINCTDMRDKVQLSSDADGPVQINILVPVAINQEINIHQDED